MRPKWLFRRIMDPDKYVPMVCSSLTEVVKALTSFSHSQESRRIALSTEFLDAMTENLNVVRL